jgi:hypothetical protein
MPDDNKRERDLQGRWVKGVSGNPKGRPPKFLRIDAGDLETFMNTIREVSTPDGEVMMTREAAIQHRLYQSAMQGNVHAQIFLARRFEKYYERKAHISNGLQDLFFNLKETGRHPTEQEQLWMYAARVFLRDLPREDGPPPMFRKPGRRRKRKRGTPVDSSEP